MGACGSKPQNNIVAEPPSIFNMERCEANKKATAEAAAARVDQVVVEDNSEFLVERVRQLELENAKLREHLKLLAGAKAVGTPASTAANGRLAHPEVTPPPADTNGETRLQLAGVRTESKSFNGISMSSLDIGEIGGRGVTDQEAELEAEAADLSSSWTVQIEPEPRARCTVIKVQAPNREQLLTDISRILNGLGLVIADAHISTEGDEAVDEFWVQERAEDGSGEMRPAQDLHAIQQRLRQWSDGKKSIQQHLVRPLHAHNRLVPLHIELPWPHTALPNPPVDDPAKHPLFAILIAAIQAPGVLPFRVRSMALATLVAAEVVQTLERVKVPAGSSIVRGDAQWLLVTEGRCVVTRKDSTQSSLEAGSALCRRVIKAGMRGDEVEEASQLETWEDAHFTEGGVLGVMHISTLRSQLQTARTVLARSHAQQLASSPLFAPLSPAQLLALCHRATEIELAPGDNVYLESFDHFGYSTAAVAISPGGAKTRSFHVILRGALSVSMERAHLPVADSDLPDEIPIARLEPISTIGEMGALTGQTYLPGLLYSACEDGAALLIWPVDTFLRDHLNRLPLLMSIQWISQSPLALLGLQVELSQHLKPLSIDSLAEHAAEAADADGGADTTLLLVVSGELIDDVASVDVRPASAARKAVSRTGSRENLFDSLVADSGAPSGAPASAAMAAASLRPKSPSNLSEASSTPPTSAHRGPLLDVTVDLHSVTCTDVSEALVQAGLKIISASIHSDDTTKDGLLDTTTMLFRVRAPQYAHLEVLTKHNVAILDQIRHALNEKLAALLAPGNWPLLTSRLAAGNWTPLRADRLPRAKEGSMNGSSAKPTIALLDLALVGRELATIDSQAGEMWRRFVKVHAPGLLEPVGFAAANSATWIDAINKYQLFKLREAAGQVEDGVTEKDLEQGPQLGQGGFGVVVLARHVIVPDAWYAVKSMKKPPLTSADDRELLHRMQTEKRVMEKLSHESRTTGARFNTRELFVRLVSAWEDEQHLHLVMPAALGGELFELLQAFGRMNETALQFYVACIVLGLQHLHSLSIVYRDLKSSNILLSATGWPMLADFGFATFATAETPLHKLCGTPEFVAPEVARGLGYGTAVDWWSLGIVMCHCLTLSTPFEDASGDAAQTIQNICDGKVTLPPAQHYSKLGGKATTSIIEALLQADPAQRLGSHLLGAEVRVHQFFWGLAWDELEKRQLTPPHRAHTEEKARARTNLFDRPSPKR